MKGINRESVIALGLLVFTAIMWAATYEIPNPGYQTMGSEVWPRIVLVGLAVLSLVYLVGSFTGRFAEPEAEGEAHGRGIAAWYGHYRNPLWCFFLFVLFLATMPLLGMLLGGILFVLATLSVIGNNTPRDIATHAAIAVVMVGGMWAIFTFALGVILPEGEILGPW